MKKTPAAVAWQIVSFVIYATVVAQALAGLKKANPGFADANSYINRLGFCLSQLSPAASA